MEELEPVEYRPVTILDVLGVDLCARAILDLVHVKDLARSERVSRRWQRAVCHYLQTCRTLSYEGFRYLGMFSIPNKKQDHRTISNHKYEDCLPLMRKTLHKWGPYIRKVIIDIGKDTDLDVIVSECPNLEQITLLKSDNNAKRDSVALTRIQNVKQLKQIQLIDFERFSKTNHSDLVLGEQLQDITCENITIYFNKDLNGSFLKSLTSDSLKSLSLTKCRSLRVSDLLSAKDNIRNLTSLEIAEVDDAPMLNDVHLLLVEMPQLEQLTLWFSYIFTSLSEECIQAVSRLDNLKKLTMLCTRGRVNDTVLETLARGCRKLEYLKIHGSVKSVTARGLTALCCRLPSARTTLHYPFTGFQNCLLKKRFLRKFNLVPLRKELAWQPSVSELTLEWRRDPRGCELSLNPTRGSRAEEPQKELKLIIF